MEPNQSNDLPPAKHARGRSRFFSVIVPLLLINVGVGQLLWSQIAPAVSADTTAVKDESATLPTESEAETDATQEVAVTTDDTFLITTYTVKSGDTLSGIAAKFNISVNTIRWANDLTEKTSKISIGDELVILPVTGIEYTVKKGDTLSGIAAKFDANQDDILKYNDIEKDAIKVGLELIIPGAEPLTTKAPVKKVAPPPTPKTTTTKETAKTTPSSKTPSFDDDTSDTPPPSSSSTYAHPIPGAVLTQRIHDGNAVDFGAAIGTTVVASAGGVVTIAKSSGYNGGYGEYIVITHPLGSQTLYAHLSQLNVSVGDKVSQGQVIGKSGNTGLSTGPHLHFKIINGPRNPFASLPLH